MTTTEAFKKLKEENRTLRDELEQWEEWANHLRDGIGHRESVRLGEVKA
jgi:hypothetical protein